MCAFCAWSSSECELFLHTLYIYNYIMTTVRFHMICEHKIIGHCVFGSNKLFCPVSHFANICHKSVLLIKEISVLCYPSLLEHPEQHSYARGIDPHQTPTVVGVHEDICILWTSSTFWLRWFRCCWFIDAGGEDVNKCTGRDAGRANRLL